MSLKLFVISGLLLVILNLATEIQGFRQWYYLPRRYDYFPGTSDASDIDSLSDEVPVDENLNVNRRSGPNGKRSKSFSSWVFGDDNEMLDIYDLRDRKSSGYYYPRYTKRSKSFSGWNFYNENNSPYASTSRRSYGFYYNPYINPRI